MKKYNKLQLLFQSFDFNYPTENPNDYVSIKDKNDTENFLKKIGWRFDNYSNKWIKENNKKDG